MDEKDRKPERAWRPHSGYCACRLHHPHLHCVVPGGGIAPDRSRWIACRRQFLLPVKVLSRLFRAKFANYLRRAYQRGELSFHGQLQPLGEKQNFFPWLNRIVQSEWVVYAKPPFGGPHQVLKYLARYTRRVAITNRRLIALQNDQVSFRWKDYRRSGQPAVMTLSATEFIRRFLLHVLPRGFVKTATLASWLIVAARTISAFAARCCARLHPTSPAHPRLPRNPPKPNAVRFVARAVCSRSRDFCRKSHSATATASRCRCRHRDVILHESCAITC